VSRQTRQGRALGRAREGPQRRALTDKLAEIKDDEERLLIATGKYLGEGFDDARSICRPASSIPLQQKRSPDLRLCRSQGRDVGPNVQAATLRLSGIGVWDKRYGHQGSD